MFKNKIQSNTINTVRILFMRRKNFQLGRFKCLQRLHGNAYLINWIHTVKISNLNNKISCLCILYIAWIIKQDLLIPTRINIILNHYSFLSDSIQLPHWVIGILIKIWITPSKLQVAAWKSFWIYVIKWHVISCSNSASYSPFEIHIFLGHLVNFPEGFLRNFHYDLIFLSFILRKVVANYFNID